MTPAEFRAARKRLGLSTQEMAQALGIEAERAIRRYEDGTREISGPVRKLIEVMLAARPAE